MARWGVLAAIALIVVVAGLSRITLDVDITRLLPPKMKETRGYQLFLRHFSRPEELIVTLEGHDAEKMEAAAKDVAAALEAHPELIRRAVWRAPWEGEPQSMTEFTAWALLNQPPERLAELEKRTAPDQLAGTLEKMLEKLSLSLGGEDGLLGYDPLGLTTGLQGAMANMGDRASEFVAADGKFRVIYAEAPSAPGNYRQITEWLAKVRTVADRAASPHGATVHFTGEPAFVSEISNSMERDMRSSGLMTMALTALIVWLAFRNLRVLPALVASLAVIFLLTIGIAGLAVGSLTVLTVGFASILIGLSADYGVLVYQASLSPDLSAADLRRTRGPGILWAAATTAASFVALWFTDMPGLAELGLIVAIGVVLGALVFLGPFPGILVRLRAARPLPTVPDWLHRPFFGRPMGWIVGLVTVGAASGLLFRGLPRVDADSGSLRPKSSEAYATLDRLQERLGGSADLVSVLVTGPDDRTVADRLAVLHADLEKARAEGAIDFFALPDPLWPRPDRLAENLSGAAGRLAADSARLRAGVIGAGFEESAFGLADGVFRQWSEWKAAGKAPELPQSPASQWILRRVVRILPQPADASGLRCLAAGMIRPVGEAGITRVESVQRDGVFLAGSRLLNRVLERFLNTGFLWLAVLFTAVTFGLLAFALRGWRPFLLTLASLALSFSALCGAMAWFGLAWNAFTLPAMLLSLGTGSDYFIYVILHLQRHGADFVHLRTRLGQAIVTCVGISTVGFGSLAQAGNAGLASLGIVCALALVLNLLNSLFLMPWGWRWLTRNAPPVP